jgi:hypothetical protein
MVTIAIGEELRGKRSYAEGLSRLVIGSWWSVTPLRAKKDTPLLDEW